MISTAESPAPAQVATDSPPARSAGRLWTGLRVTARLIVRLELLWLLLLSPLLPQLPRGLPGAERGFIPNEVGGVLLLIVPPALVLCAWSWRAARRAMLVAALTFATLLTVLVLLLTQSRSAAAGLIVAAAVL